MRYARTCEAFVIGLSLLAGTGCGGGGGSNDDDSSGERRYVPGI